MKQRNNENLSIISFDGLNVFESTIEYWIEADKAKVHLKSAAVELESCGDDFFEALQVIRSELEPLGYLLFCAGARADAYPSRMSRQMGKAGKVYLNVLNIPASKDSLVDIFDNAQFDQVTTVAQQYENYIFWLNTLTEKL